MCLLELGGKIHYSKHVDQFPGLSYAQPLRTFEIAHLKTLANKLMLQLNELVFQTTPLSDVLVDIIVQFADFSNCWLKVVCRSKNFFWCTFYLHKTTHGCIRRRRCHLRLKICQICFLCLVFFFVEKINFVSNGLTSTLRRPTNSKPQGHFAATAPRPKLSVDTGGT